MIAEMHTDGGARPCNPGHAAFAAVIKIQGTGKKHVISRYLGRRHTNNFAEMAGVFVGSKYANELGVKDLYIYCDSKLIVGALADGFQIKKNTASGAELKALADDTLKFLEFTFSGHWSITHIPRKENTSADGHCMAAINWGRRLNPWLPAAYRDSRYKFGKVHDPFNSSDKYVAALLRGGADARALQMSIGEKKQEKKGR